MNTYQEVDEMTDSEIRLRYGDLVQTAAIAFSVDASYCADIAKKARVIQARVRKRKG